ncbi:sensor histidine kinase [Roseateles amylovorans]|uniref:ATP-binding protein n=1 Tax=Roseateles amylovorans TaxID=2978473 RepID=A0ABY6B065_9BURK|nr:ATP-binding protein [Roseateles amylovorans]UXH77953.1 ATP-binding protein [Roseateles amylovorans]
MHRTAEQQQPHRGPRDSIHDRQPHVIGVALALLGGSIGLPSAALAQTVAMGPGSALPPTAAGALLASGWPELIGTVAFGLHAMLLLLAVALSLLIWQRRAQRHLGWLIALMPGWVLLAGVAPATGAPVAFALTLAPWLLWSAAHYLMRRLRRRDRRLHRLLLVQAVVLPFALLLPVPAPLVATAALWWLSAQLLGAMAWHIWHLWQDMFLPTLEERYPRAEFMVSCGLMGLGALAVVAACVWPQSGLAQMLAPLTLIGLGLQRVRAFARALTHAELQVLQGELRLQERIAELERHFDQVAEAKLEQVTERERKRIAADLHDDLGAKLLTIVHTSESDRISTLAREALEEMRLSVRGLTGKPVQLLDALGDWRAEVVSRLAQANILAEWKSPAEDIEHTFPARAYVQTTRILREAVSNIIKHSGATHCVVACSAQDGYFSVVIQDNGQGIPLELEGRLDKGHGMASMKSRAKQMHGQCLVESGPGWGTVIRLTIPL